MIVSFSNSRTLLALALFTTTACAVKSGEVGSLLDGESEGGGSEGTGETGMDMTTSTGGPDDSLPEWCLDIDRDGVPDPEDNAVEDANPTQNDIDADGIADAIDLCPTLAGATNTADSDKDGVGNDCDVCRQVLEQYNEDAEAAGVPSYMQVRNVPSQADADEDGIGDACDNCVWTPNCADFGPDNPWGVGDSIPYDDGDLCQTDADADLVGDACAGMTVRPDAAGPIGFGNADDFDQDGISNELDGCPRHPITDLIACGGPGDCPADRNCDDGWCDHEDSDFDGVGNTCDTCAYSGNPMQTLEGGMQEDDEDGDFVGSVCETSPACSVYPDARPFGFFAVQAGTECCTVRLIASPDELDDPATEAAPDVAIGDLLDAATCEGPTPSASSCAAVRARHPDDPDATLPVRTSAECPEEQVGGVWLCRQLRPAAEQTPGILVPPPGCDEALADAGMTALQNTIAPLTDPEATQCFLPQRDQDYDGIGDVCDLCPHGYDPENIQYVDDNGMLWPNDGQICNGEFEC